MQVESYPARTAAYLSHYLSSGSVSFTYTKFIYRLSIVNCVYGWRCVWVVRCGAGEFVLAMHGLASCSWRGQVNVFQVWSGVKWLSICLPVDHYSSLSVCWSTSVFPVVTFQPSINLLRCVLLLFIFACPSFAASVSIPAPFLYLSVCPLPFIYSYLSTRVYLFASLCPCLVSASTCAHLSSLPCCLLLPVILC